MKNLPFVGDIPYREMRKPFVFSRSISEKSFECLNPSPPCPKPVYVSNQKKVSKFLSRIPSFIENKPPVHDIGVFFSTMQRILIEVDEDLNWSFMIQLPHDTLDTTIAHIMHMKNYIAFEKMEVVGCPIFFYS